MRAVVRAGWIASLLWAAVAAAPVQAAPVTYLFTSGSAALSATFAGLTIGSGSIPLSGTQVTFDPSPAELVSFHFGAGPATLPLSGILSGVSITLTGATLAPGAGYSNISVVGPLAPPSTYVYTVGPVDVAGSASFSGLLSTSPTAFSFTNPTLSGQLRVVPASGGELALNGITLGVLDVPAFGFFPGGPVTIKADVIFRGVVPEPGTALLFSLGLAAIGVRRRASS